MTATQKIPDEGVTLSGKSITLTLGKNDDLTVRIEGERTTHYSHHPFAINDFREQTGQEPIVYAPVKAKVIKCADDEHDWDWVDPEDDDSRAIVCSKCGELGEAEDDDDGEA